MNTIRFLFYTFFVAYHFLAHTHEIIHTNDISQVLQYVESPTDLVVLDLDETLITLDHGEHWLAEICKQKKVSLDHIIDLYIWQAMQEEYRLLESHAPEIIAQLQKQGITVIALTARSTERLLHYTTKELTRLGIDFARSALFAKNFVIEGLPHPASCCQGIISCSKNNKGMVLMRALELTHCKPTKIIFVDDKLKHVESVQEQAQLNNIPFAGLRYGRTDGTVVTLTQADHLNFHAWVDGIPCIVK